MVQLTVTGTIPSKKNRNYIRCINGYPIVGKDAKYNAWVKEKQWELKARNIGLIETVSKVVITMYPPDRRRADLTNKAESLMDLMVDVGILKDDNWFIVPEVALRMGGVDKLKPRAEIQIYA